MGPSRTIREAYRQRTGNEGAIQASGNWNDMAFRHEWPARARAWDQHQQVVYQAAIEGAIRTKARDWARRRDERLEAEYQLGRQLIERATTISKFPAAQQTVSADGKTTIINPIDTEDLRKAAVIGTAGSALARGAIEAALAIDASKEKLPDPVREAAAREKAMERLEAWRAEWRAKILAQPTAPPTATD
jgi:hypothetical protein